MEQWGSVTCIIHIFTTKLVHPAIASAWKLVFVNSVYWHEAPILNSQSPIYIYIYVFIEKDILDIVLVSFGQRVL